MAHLPRNFRSVVEPRVFRSANPDSSEPEALQRWINERDIAAIIDLRSKSDISKASALKNNVEDFFPLQSPEEFLKSPTPTSPTRVSVNLDRKDFYLAILLSGTFVQRICMFFLILWMFITGDRTPMFRYGAKHILGRQGLHKMYNILIDSSLVGIRSVFEVMLKVGKRGVVISCQLGKDRTGVICAILMDLMGKSKQEIIDNFHASELGLKDVQDEIDKWFAERNFPPEEFAKAAKRSMELTLNHIYEKYGGSEGYLKFLGLSDNDIEQLKSNMRD